MDLSQLSAMLSGLLGPWGVVAAMGVFVAVQWLRKRRPDLFPEPTAPSPPAGPSVPAPDGSRFPLLDGLRKLLGRGGKPLVSVRDLSPETLAAVRAELDVLSAEQAADLRAKLGRVEAVVPPPPAEGAIGFKG